MKINRRKRNEKYKKNWNKKMEHTYSSNIDEYGEKGSKTK